MKGHIIIDLDGTLADCAHRVHLAVSKEWDAFHAGIPDDQPRKDVAEFLASMTSHYIIILCTGRDERHRDATVAWLRKFHLHELVDELLMRPPNDHSPDHELKPWLVAEHFGSLEKAREEVLMVLDDRDRVVEAWRNSGFTCWQVAIGSY